MLLFLLCFTHMFWPFLLCFSPLFFSPLISSHSSAPFSLFTLILSPPLSLQSAVCCLAPLLFVFSPEHLSIYAPPSCTTAVSLYLHSPLWSHCRGNKRVQRVSWSELQVSLPRHPRSLQGSCWWTEQLSSLQRAGLSHRKTDVSLQFSCLHYLPR